VVVQLVGARRAFGDAGQLAILGLAVAAFALAAFAVRRSRAAEPPRRGIETAGD
jgi:hypothetical protein